MSLWKFSVVSGFSNILYGKKTKLGNAGNRQKALQSLLIFEIARKLLKLLPFWLQKQTKLPSDVNAIIIIYLFTVDKNFFA